MQKSHGILALSQLTENSVLTVEPGTGHESDEELRAIGVGSCIGHGEEEG